MAHPDTSAPWFDLPLKPIPTVPTNFPTIVTATIDNLPGYFETDSLETITIPHGWNIHFDVITEMRNERCWEDVSDLIAVAVKLSEAGAKFANKWNQTVNECFRGWSPDEHTVKLKLKEGVVTAWNEEMAKLKREMETKLWSFERNARRKKFEDQVKKCFGEHRNLGADGDGETWWDKTVERLSSYGEQWMMAPFTFEMWLSDLAVQVTDEAEIREINVYADVLSASYKQVVLKTREERIFWIKDGEIKDRVAGKKGKLAWVSTELGHRTSS